MDCAESVACFQQYSHFHNIDSSKPGTWYIYPSVCVIFHFFHQCLIVFCIQVFSLFVVVCYSVAKLCPTLWDPMNCSTPGFPVLHYLPEFAQTHVHWVSDAIQSSHPLSPLLLLPLIFASIRVLSNELALCIRWPDFWSFIFSISPSNKYSRLISFRIGFFR